LQSEWDTSKQRVEDLSKCNGKLEAVFAAEEQKASNLASQLSQANELNGRLERHIQWLQSEWDTSKLNLGKIEVLFTAEEQKAGNLASQLNQANDQSIRQQAHAQWLQNQWNAAQVKINELNQSQQHWQTLANAYNQERKALYASYSWRITRPLRLITTGFRMLFKALLTIPLAIWWLVKWPFKLILSALIRLAIKHPALKSGIGVWLKNYPKLFTHSLLFARARGINIDATPPQLTEIQELSEPLAVENTPDLTNLTPRARRIYNDLKDAMDSNYKNKESS
jgi:O-antigen chain-terminating methyltransferase